MTMICGNATEITREDGFKLVKCSGGHNPSGHVGYGYCKGCKDNTAKGVWPDQLPIQPVIVTVGGKSQRRPLQIPQQGPGTELMKLLDAIGIKDSSGCGCATKARKMNEWGPDECQRQEAVIAGWLMEAARKTKGWEEPDAEGQAIFEGLVKGAIQMAIDNARKNAVLSVPVSAIEITNEVKP